jgi:hypothetical protein
MSTPDLLPARVSS